MHMLNAFSFDADKLIDAVMASYPESSACIKCIDFDYNACVFEFWDYEVTWDTRNDSVVPAVKRDLELRRSGHVEDAVVYVLDRNALRIGVWAMVVEIENGGLKGLNLGGANFLNPSNWDMWCCDALVQCAIFGKTIYG